MTTIGYVALLGQQDSLNGFDARIAVVLALLAGFTILSAVGAVTSSATTRAIIAAACAGGLISLGILAAFSIGLPLLAAGSVALVAWLTALRDASTRSPTVWSAAACVGAMAALAGGFAASS